MKRLHLRNHCLQRQVQYQDNISLYAQTSGKECLRLCVTITYQIAVIQQKSMKSQPANKLSVPRHSGSRAKNTPVPPGTPGELPYRLMTSKYGYPRSKQEAGISLKANIKVLLHDSIFWFCIFFSCQRESIILLLVLPSTGFIFWDKINRQNVHFSIFC